MLEEEIRKEIRRIARFREDEEPRLESITHKRFEPSTHVRPMIAVDGSYSFLLNISSMWLAVVRVGALKYIFKNGGYRLVSNESVEKPVLISTRKEVVSRQSELHRHLFQLWKGGAEGHRQMMSEFRHFTESQLSYAVSKENKRAIIAIDGTLASFHNGSDLLSDVTKVCEQNDNILVGVSKDSQSHAFGSPRTDEELLSNIDVMAYARVPEGFEKEHRGTLHGDVYFARMHQAAPKWFRVDVGTYKSDPDFVFSNLAHYTRSGLCLGYPYPLLEAHRYAITIRQLREVYEDLALKAGIDAGMSLGEVVEGLTRVEGERLGAFHEYLDRVSRDVR